MNHRNGNISTSLSMTRRKKIAQTDKHPFRERNLNRGSMKCKPRSNFELISRWKAKREEKTKRKAMYLYENSGFWSFFWFSCIARSCVTSFNGEENNRHWAARVGKITSHDLSRSQHRWQVLKNGAPEQDGNKRRVCATCWGTHVRSEGRSGAWQRGLHLENSYCWAHYSIPVVLEEPCALPNARQHGAWWRNAQNVETSCPQTIRDVNLCFAREFARLITYPARAFRKS